MRKLLRIMHRVTYDRQRKERKRQIESEKYSYDSMCKLQNFVTCLPKCLKGVSWKASVQRYYLDCILNILSAYKSLRERMLLKSISDKEIVIYERGKARIITPVHIKDRMFQKVLCDYVLTPIITPKLIYDNGASLKGKGVMFSRNRVNIHLLNAIKEFGVIFYILCFDFKSFFDSIPHRTCRKILRRYIKDEDIVSLTMDIIKAPHLAKIKKIKDKETRDIEFIKLANDEYKGICLGSQVSQIIALVIANDLDHFIKDKMGMKYYDRYMDDGIIMAKTKEELQQLLVGMKEVCDELGLHFNLKKTHIVKSSKGFTFLKVRYFVTSSGKVVKKLTAKGVTRMRRKLKKFRKHIDIGTMTNDNAYDSMQSWLAHSKVANSYKTVRNMLKLYDSLFNGYRIRNKEGTKRVLQADRREKHSWNYFQQRLPKAPKAA